MIIPWLKGLRLFHEAPLTWTLISINLLFFFLTNGVQAPILNLSKDEIKLAGRSYSMMKQQEVPRDSSELLLRGTQALRDLSFFEQYRNFDPTSDAVALKAWQLKLDQFQADLKKRPVDMFGLHGQEKHPTSWLTYQFMHSGAWHLLGNMVMLMIFGAALEAISGSALLVFVYVLGGFAGALFFLLASPDTSSPMVGASASLSAVMAFYALFERRKRVKFFYFLSPSPGYWGDIYLPTLLVLPFYFVEDLAQYFSTAEEIGAGVAYSAHLGGALFGIVMAVGLKHLCRRSPHWEQILYASYSRSQHEAP
ncbi:MAG: rhomboid family intramembrane serine protease [Bdellovibrio sp.]